jgi:hypothetical protein
MITMQSNLKFLRIKSVGLIGCETSREGISIQALSDPLSRLENIILRDIGTEIGIRIVVTIIIRVVPKVVVQARAAHAKQWFALFSPVVQRRFKKKRLLLFRKVWQMTPGLFNRLLGLIRARHRRWSQRMSVMGFLMKKIA